MLSKDPNGAFTKLMEWQMNGGEAFLPPPPPAETSDNENDNSAVSPEDEEDLDEEEMRAQQKN